MIKNSRKSWIFSSKIQIQNLKFFTQKNPNDHVLAKSTAFQNQRLQQNTKWNTTLLKNVRMMFAVIFLLNRLKEWSDTKNLVLAIIFPFHNHGFLIEKLWFSNFLPNKLFCQASLGVLEFPQSTGKKKYL